MTNKMIWNTDETFKIEIDGARLECRAWGPSPDASMTIILLHEGLGSVAQWKAFPEKLANATGCGVFAYSRSGYGGSSPAELPRPLDYMTQEAVNTLPKVLDEIGLKRGVLLGHSDGASIAAIYAGSLEDFRVRGLVLMAPHFFAEPSGLEAIAKARIAFDEGDLAQRLAKYHDDPENTFRGWNDAWLDPDFANWNIEEVIAYLRVPVLAIQGEDDQYGTLAQIEALENALYSPLDKVVLNGCQHAPHLESEDETFGAVTEFIRRLDAIEGEIVKVA